jgi:glycosyltransferase involved in cell wall biosynthesis
MKPHTPGSPLVTVVMPAFNSAAFIAATIHSALAQTFPDFELLVVDDESTDNTGEAAYEAAAGDPRVTVIRQSHGGIGKARNTALDAARGRFIALLDSDDLWMPDYLEQQLAMLERFPDRAIVTANAISRGGVLDGRPVWPKTTGFRKLSLRDLIVEENAVCIMSMFRREVVEGVGGFDPVFRRNEDYEFWIRSANAGFSIVQNCRPTCFYTRRPNSVSADDARMLAGIIMVLAAASHREGPIALERDVIARKIGELNDELLRMRMRGFLMQQDGRGAALALKTLSEIRHSWSLGVAARVGLAWPQLLTCAYDLRRSLRAG